MSRKTLLIKKFDKIEYTLVELDGKLLLGINYRRNKYDTLNEVRGSYRYIEELAEDLEKTDYLERHKFIWILNVKPDLARYKYPKKVILKTHYRKIELKVRREYRRYTLIIDNVIGLDASTLKELLNKIKIDPELKKFYPTLLKKLRPRVIV